MTKDKFVIYLSLVPKTGFRSCFSALIIMMYVSPGIFAESLQDSVRKSSIWSFHFQNTVILQNHPAFHAEYSGKNSLNSEKENKVSISSTAFIGIKLWRQAQFFFNPELSAGGGFSQSLGVAGFPNGEVYRISDPAPHVYIARCYLRQVFALDNEYIDSPDAVNQVAGKVPLSYFAVYAGKFSIMDFYDNNSYSHDPRSQFFNWALMGNGAWDYPANTRGYTYGVTLEMIKHDIAFRIAAVMVPKIANGSVMDNNILHSHALAFEFNKNYTAGNHRGTIRAVTFLNKARMGSYINALNWGKIHNLPPEIDSVGQLGNTKFGIGINIEQKITDQCGLFMRAGWNDGHNETWAFTEIDRSFSAGFLLNGSLLARYNYIIGFAQIINGISNEHRNYLAEGGYGFIIGDGKLNYNPEYITEVYYSLRLCRYNFWICPDYQFICHPAYNKDRGPVHVFGIRMHTEL